MSTNYFNNLIYLFLCSTERDFKIFIILGCSYVPILQLIMFSSENCMVGFNKVSSFEKILSRGTKPLGIKFHFNSIILDPTIVFFEYSAPSSTSSSCSRSINELEKSPVNSKNLLISK